MGMIYLPGIGTVDESSSMWAPQVQQFKEQQQAMVDAGQAPTYVPNLWGSTGDPTTTFYNDHITALGNPDSVASKNAAAAQAEAMTSYRNNPRPIPYVLGSPSNYNTFEYWMQQTGGADTPQNRATFQANLDAYNKSNEWNWTETLLNSAAVLGVGAGMATGLGSMGIGSGLDLAGITDGLGSLFSNAGITGFGDAGIEAGMLGGPAATVEMAAGTGGAITGLGDIVNSTLNPETTNLVDQTLPATTTPTTGLPTTPTANPGQWTPDGMTQDQITQQLIKDGVLDSSGNLIPGVDATKSGLLTQLAQTMGTSPASLLSTLGSAATQLASSGQNIPFSNIIGGLLGYAGTQATGNLQMSLLDKAINADQWRTQQPKYFGAVENSALNGQMPQSYLDQITNDSTKKMASMGYNMSGNQISQLGQDVNRGNLDYLKTITPLAMGNGSAAATAAVAGMTPGIVSNQQQGLGNLGVATNSLLNSDFLRNLFNSSGTASIDTSMTGSGTIPNYTPDTSFGGVTPT